MLCLRAILTLLLALQVVNPMCCCTGCAEGTGSCCEASTARAPDQAPTTAPSCCSRTSPADCTDPGSQGVSSNEPSPGDQHPCLCASKQTYTKYAQATIPCAQATTLPEPSVIELLPLATAHALAPAPPKVEHHPPGPPLRLRYSIFRL